MKATPTLSGGLHILPQAEADWALLRAIVSDANAEKLAADLSAPMDEDSCWDDIVQPELETYFNGQLQTVIDHIKTSPEGGFTIERDQLWDWYGALNQARLQLEATHHLHDLRIEELNTFPPPIRQALIREKAYGRLQSLLLSYLEAIGD